MAYQDLDLASLIDLIADYTEKYTNLSSVRSSTPELNDCKSTLDIIQAEIERRKNQPENILIPVTDEQSVSSQHFPQS